MAAPGFAGLVIDVFWRQISFHAGGWLFTTVTTDLPARFAPGLGPRFAPPFVVPVCAAMSAVVRPCSSINARIWFTAVWALFEINASSFN
ncbi:hypothetical protein P3T23_001551 [Paraburkholderia sp. GAS448]|uniref:hypothetical protein n=1 Tax=Paraburkholderia sp. GAS448 TaxID=3035136 RepID=UPI003D1ABC27